MNFTGGQARGDDYVVPVNDQSQYFAVALSVGGYRAISDKFLLGAGIDYSPLSGKSAPYALIVPSANLTINGSYEKQDSYTVFISPGYSLDDDRMVYGKLGYTGMDLESTVAGAKDTGSYNGYAVGIGYKQMFADNRIFGFVESNYYSYSSRADGNGFSGSNAPRNFSILAGVGIKF